MAGLERLHARRGWPEGKLEEAARKRVFALLDRNDPTQPLQIDAAIADDFAVMGVTIDPEELDEEDVFEIWDINVAAFEVFRALDTQWHCIAVAGLGAARLIRTGLNYAGVEIVMRNCDLPKEQFELIQAMEMAALEAFAEAEQ